jgi:fatty-acid peroxygenase
MERTGESSVAFVRDGYLFGTRAFERLSTDAFHTRLLGLPTVVMRGEDAARFFYEGGRFDRAGAIPKSVSHLLQDERSVQTLEGDAHRRRKELFLGLLTGPGEQQLAQAFSAELERTVRSGAGASSIRLIDLVDAVLTRAVCSWAGIPDAVTDDFERTDVLAGMVEHAGDVGPVNWLARVARRRAERLLVGAVEDARAVPASAPPGSALAVIADYREPVWGGEEWLPAEVAAVELLNVLRPTVAVGRFMVFAAHALHRHPEWKDRLAANQSAVGDSDADVRRFSNEVRRFYPFFPVIAGRATRECAWHGHRFRERDRVMLDLYATNHDPAIWPNPRRFHPDRFAGVTVEPNTLIPQGGGQYTTGHRCPGEPATLQLLDEAVRWLSQRLVYVVPPQDLRISLRRFPALPEDGFVVSGMSVADHMAVRDHRMGRPPVTATRAPEM